jgi:hypothetical protein
LRARRRAAGVHRARLGPEATRVQRTEQRGSVRAAVPEGGQVGGIDGHVAAKFGKLGAQRSRHATDAGVEPVAVGAELRGEAVAGVDARSAAQRGLQRGMLGDERVRAAARRNRVSRPRTTTGLASFARPSGLHPVGTAGATGRPVESDRGSRGDDPRPVHLIQRSRQAASVLPRERVVGAQLGEDGDHDAADQILSLGVR